MDTIELVARITQLMTEVRHDSGLIFVTVETPVGTHYREIKAIKHDETGNICIALD